MSSFFGEIPSHADLQFEGFFDGQKKIMPDNLELTAIVVGGFSGVEEGKAQRVFKVELVITSPGEFYGQSQMYNSKAYDLDARKRDQAMKNLSVIDAQAGFPMHHAKIQAPTTEDIENMWAGKAHVRIKMGYGTSMENEVQPDPSSPSGYKTTEVLKEFNWIRGFGYLREKMLPPVGSGQEVERIEARQGSSMDMPGDQNTRKVQQAISEHQQQYQGTPVDSDSDIGF